jgi:hypothetical protein
MSIQQPPITREGILQMRTLTPRRCKLSIEDRKIVHEPTEEGKDWSVRLPFYQTFRNAFHSMCDIDCNWMREGNGNCYTYLRNEDEETFEAIDEWLDNIGQYVVLRDCLALSFALDYGYEDGNPNNSKTRIGKLRSKAKPYESTPTLETFDSADEMFQDCMQFISDIHCYNEVDAIVAMPPSKPDKAFDLPLYLVKKMCREWGKPDLSYAVKTIHARPPIKNQETPEAKLKVLEGSVQVDQNIIRGKSILILDDLYQSGVSMNYVAMLLQEAGASKIFGLACEKTSRNDANPSRR